MNSAPDVDNGYTLRQAGAASLQTYARIAGVLFLLSLGAAFFGLVSTSHLSMRVSGL